MRVGWLVEDENDGERGIESELASTGLGSLSLEVGGK